MKNTIEEAEEELKGIENKSHYADINDIKNLAKIIIKSLKYLEDKITEDKMPI